MCFRVDTIAAVFAVLAITCFSVFASANPLSPTSVATTGDVHVVGFKCGLVNGKLVCGDKQSGGNKQGGSKKQSNGDEKPKKAKDKAIPKTCGKKVNCEPGFVRLEKPNKYGACCEAREGLPPTKAAEPQKCKFPGEVGTPPNCSCPTGTEFLGYKGCVKTNSWGCMAKVASGGDVTMFLTAPSEAGAKQVYVSRLKAENKTTPSGPITCRLRG